jgi:hypothetical protein
MSTILQDLEDDITSECWMIHSDPTSAAAALDTVTLSDFICDHHSSQQQQHVPGLHSSCWDDYPDASSSLIVGCGGGGDGTSCYEDEEEDVIMATKRVSLDATATATTCTGWTTNTIQDDDDDDAATPFELMDVDKDPILSHTLPISISFIETVVDHNYNCWGESGFFDTAMPCESSRIVSINSSSKSITSNTSEYIPNNQSMDTTSTKNDDDNDENDQHPTNNNNHWSNQFQERRRELAKSMAASQKTRQVLRLKEHVRRRANLLKVLSDIEKSSKIIQIHLYHENDDDNKLNSISSSSFNQQTNTAIIDEAPSSNPSHTAAI